LTNTVSAAISWTTKPGPEKKRSAFYSNGKNKNKKTKNKNKKRFKLIPN
jgi:hypothetical protein